jgi:hypothetical protein
MTTHKTMPHVSPTNGGIEPPNPATTPVADDDVSEGGALLFEIVDCTEPLRLRSLDLVR